MDADALRVGIDLGGTKIEAIALDGRGRALARLRVPTPAGDYEATIHALRDLVLRLEAEAGVTGTVGVGTPGSPSPRSGLMRNCNSVCLNGRALQADLEQSLGRPVRLANDADCFALSEATDGAGAGARSVFGVILGTGTGGGIVVDGRLLAGPNGVAGEWGHNPLPWARDDERPGPPCYCGKQGCIETFLSGSGLSRAYAAASGREAPAAEVARLAAEGGDAAAASALESYADRLARGLASVINVLDPDVIVLGGGLSAVADLYRRVPAIWGRYVFSDVVRTRLSPPAHGDASGVRGAAWLWPA
jgi:predicted NBD/HSP70 family sugar kinase